MDIFIKLAEQKIDEARARGELDSLPGKGAPIEIEDNSHIPKELRMAFHVLGNSGVVPPEVHLMNEIQLLKNRLKDEVGLCEEAKVKLKIELSRKIANLSVLKERLTKPNSL